MNDTLKRNFPIFAQIDEHHSEERISFKIGVTLIHLFPFLKLNIPKICWPQLLAKYQHFLASSRIDGFSYFHKLEIW